MKKLIIALAVTVPLLLAAGFGLYYYLFMRPYDLAENTMPQSGAKLHESADGTLTLTWPEGENADDYLVELSSDEDVFWRAIYTTTSCVLPTRLNLSGDITLTITSRKAYETPRDSYVRPCAQPLTASYPAVLPHYEGLEQEVDADYDTLTLTWDAVPGGVYTVYDSQGNEVCTTREGRAVITFGDNVPMPAKDTEVSFTLGSGLEGMGVEFTTDVTESVSVVGEDLRGTVLIMKMEERGNNFYTLTWNETRGERYELQELDEDGNWNVLRSYTDKDPLTATLGPLEPFTDHSIRVVALGGHTLPGSDFAATPASVNISTTETTMYATIWVLKDLDIWADTNKSQKVGTATTDTAYCVAGEVGGFFLIYFDGGRGYIDSSYCLINLPDYLGELIDYDITNSYDSKYMVHDYGIPTVTGTVITGYEEVASDYTKVTVPRTVRQDVDEEGNKIDLPQWKSLYETEDVEIEEPQEFLVPLLYPTAKKVLRSAVVAREDGYKLKIYDAYRPYEATRFLYDFVEGLLQDQVPEAVYSEMEGDRWADYLTSLLPPEEQPPEGETPAEGQAPADGQTNTDGQAPAEGGTTTGTTGTTGTTTEDKPETPRDTYYKVMTNGSYSLNAFLAKSGSYHNMGIAVDLTLERIDTGEELTMQTAMHDLSWNAVLSKNNDNAKLLAKYMTDSRLGTLSSEWWHFQDDELRKQVGSLILRKEGVTRAGWVADVNGWRYRDHDGSFLTGGTYKVNGHTYTFDENGYSDYAAWETPDLTLEGTTDTFS